MKWIAIFIMKLMLQKAKKEKFECKDVITKIAYQNVIENYETTIMYLKYNQN